jgi:hypothetical protein
MKKLFAAAIAVFTIATPAQASVIPGTNVPYATYRQQLFNNGWRPNPFAPCCGPYKETSVGNRTGSGHWFHPATGKQITVHIWPCKHGWCLSPKFD